MPLPISSTAVLNFEETIPPAMLSVNGLVHYTEVTANGGIPLNLNAVQTDQTVEITYQWNQSGWMLPFICNCQCKFQVFLERMGVAEFGDIPAVVLPFNNTPGLGSATVTIQPNTVPPGVYRIVACFMLKPNNSNSSPCVAFADLGLAHWYQGLP